MICIVWANKDETVAYAAKEFKKYLDKVSDTLGFGQLCQVDALPEKPEKNEIFLGTMSELGIDDSQINDVLLDDAEDICISRGSGYIAGSNPRSILFGVYDYFKSAGCRWVRPGVLGEHLVKFDPMNHELSYRKKADVTFRGECIEGADKYEHVRATVEWMPKVHMNVFQIQGIVPYNYMSFWYRHTYNTVLPDEDIGYDGLKELTVCMEKDVKRCGLLLFSMGHGYQTEPFGITYTTSFERYEMNPRMKNALAMIRGKRTFYGDPWNPKSSQLCMGNDEVLTDVVNWLTDYVESKPQIDYLDMCMGDGSNNHCECPLCTPHHPSDLYVKMLNMLDEKFTERGIKTRMVVESYVDTLWTPEIERIQHPSRFIFEAAIGGRNYSEPYDESDYMGELPVWKRNHFNAPADFAVRRKMYKKWLELCDMPNFACDYHFYFDHYNDPGTMSVAKNFYSDLHQLLSIELDGMLNCQTQRVAFPSALAVLLTGEALFDLSRSYESFESDYFSAAFGENWKMVRDYLNEITNLFDPSILRQTYCIDHTAMGAGEKPAWLDNPEYAAGVAAVSETVDRFLPTVRENLERDDRCQARSWKLLTYHGEYCKQLSEVFLCGAKGEMNAARVRFAEMRDWISHIEPEIEYEFDLRLFTQCMNRKLK